MIALDRSETLKALKMVGGYEDVNDCHAIDENFVRVLGTDELGGLLFSWFWLW